MITIRDPETLGDLRGVLPQGVLKAATLQDHQGRADRRNALLGTEFAA